MNKNLPLFTLVVLSLCSLNAQEVKWGIRGGLNLTTYSIANKHFNYEPSYYPERLSVDVKSTIGRGFYLGGFEEYEFTENFFLDAGLMLSYHESKLKESGSRSESFDTRMTEISLPIWLKYQIENFRPKAGISIEYGSYHIKSAPIYLDRSSENNFGVSLGIGCEYHFDSGFFMDANFKYGLTNLENSQFWSSDGSHSLGLKKRIFQLGVGYKF